MVVNLKALEQKKQQLLREQEELITYIKENYAEFYVWLGQNHVHLTNLRMYSANIAAAVAITVGSNLPSPTPVKTEPLEEVPQVQEIKVIARDELVGLDEGKKTLLVWERYGPLIQEASEKYQIDPKVVLATILVESGGNNKAIRYEPHINDSSYGLGQILYSTARGIGFTGTPEELFDPAVNIDLIAKYHRRNMDVYGPSLTPEQLTTAYNAGSPYSTPYPGHVKKFKRWFHEARHLIG